MWQYRTASGARAFGHAAVLHHRFGNSLADNLTDTLCIFINFQTSSQKCSFEQSFRRYSTIYPSVAAIRQFSVSTYAALYQLSFISNGYHIEFTILDNIWASPSLLQLHCVSRVKNKHFYGILDGFVTLPRGWDLCTSGLAATILDPWLPVTIERIQLSCIQFLVPKNSLAFGTVLYCLWGCMR